MQPSHFKHSEAKQRLVLFYESLYEGVISHGATPLDVSVGQRVHAFIGDTYAAKSDGVE